MFQKMESEVACGVIAFSRSGRTSLNRTGKEVGIKLGRSMPKETVNKPLEE